MTTITTSSPGRLDRLAPLALMLMAIGWGSTFFVIKDVLTRLDAADLLAVRFVLAAVVLAVILHRKLRNVDALLVRDGVIMGLFYGAGQLLQTYGLAHTSASISGFLTGLYVVMTPVIEAVLLRARVGQRVWLAAALATAGLGVLTINPAMGGFQFGWGEGLTVLSALAYAAHIVYTGRVTRPDNALALSAIQGFAIAVMCVLAALPGGIHLPRTPVDWAAVLYLAVVTGALAIVLQVWAQARVEATRAAVIMSSEPIWAAFFAILAGQEPFTYRTLIGGAALVVAMLLASLPARPARDPLPEDRPARSGSTP